MPGPTAGFVRSIALLVSGTAGAQVIAAASMPILSRLYGPAEFGLLATFTAIVLTVAVAACLRFDVAIAIPEDPSDALGLLALSLIGATVTALVGLIVVAGIGDRMAAWFDQRAWAELLWVLPVGIFCAAASSALQNWSIRQREFGLIARVRVGQALTCGGVQVGAGTLALGPAGLAWGYVANFAIGSAYLGQRIAPRFRAASASLRPSRLVELALTYRRFPLYSTWEALANNAAIHVPIIVIASATTAAEAGYLMLAMYVVQAPMSLIGSAVAQVYLSRAPETHRAGELSRFTLEVLQRLAVAGIGPLLAIAILSPVAFEWIFGTGWQRAGWLVAWMTPWFVLQFLASPLSMALHVTGQQRTALVLQIGSLAMRLAAVWWAWAWWPSVTAEAYAVSGAVVYAAYLAVVLSASGVALGPALKQLLGTWRWVARWSLPAAGAAALLWMTSGRT